MKAMQTDRRGFVGWDPLDGSNFGGKTVRFGKITQKGRNAMPKKTKLNLEFLLVKAELKGVPEKGSLRSRNIG